MHDTSARAHLAEFLAEVRTSRKPVCRQHASPAALRRDVLLRIASGIFSIDVE